MMFAGGGAICGGGRTHRGTGRYSGIGSTNAMTGGGGGGKAKFGIGEPQHRALDVNDLVGRRGWQVIFDDSETWWRIEGRRQECEAAACVVGMRAARIAAQVRPIGRRGVEAG